MSWTSSRVAWAQGMFLMPQHFQQSDRWVENLAARGLLSAGPHMWGLTHLEIDVGALGRGQIALLAAAGALPDGVLFDTGEFDPRTPNPAPITPAETLRDARVFLAAPHRRMGVADVSPTPDDTARFVSFEADVKSAIRIEALGAANGAPVELLGVNLRLLTEDQKLEGYDVIPIARIKEIESSKRIILDPDFAATCLDARAAPTLRAMLSQARGACDAQARTIGRRLGDLPKDVAGAASVRDMLMLQALNRATAALSHADLLDKLHPERLYVTLASVAADLVTFRPGGQKTFADCGALPYDHLDPAAGVRSLVLLILDSLSYPVLGKVVQINFKYREANIYSAVVEDPSLFETARFFVFPRSQRPQSELELLPGGVKVGGSDKDVKSAKEFGMRSAELRLTPRPPEIPANAGAVCFEIETRNDQWRNVKKSSTVFLMVDSRPQDLEFSMFAVRGDVE